MLTTGQAGGLRRLPSNPHARNSSYGEGFKDRQVKRDFPSARCLWRECLSVPCLTHAHICAPTHPLQERPKGWKEGIVLRAQMKVTHSI